MDLFHREDWTLFRSLHTLGQRAGVTQDVIPALVAKELVDNALDAAGLCRYGQTRTGAIFVENDGDGLSGTDEEIAALFSVARPLSTSKLLRLPTRGALGNGLRVVVGQPVQLPGLVLPGCLLLRPLRASLGVGGVPGRIAGDVLSRLSRVSQAEGLFRERAVSSA